MMTQIEGLHHVTALARDAQRNNDFFTHILGLRRVKKTVNFDRPDVYHLYYGDKVGTPGGVMTYFPFPGSDPGHAGTGEVAATVFAVPERALPYWRERLTNHGVDNVSNETYFGAARLCFSGPDGDSLALAEQPGDSRDVWTGSDIPADTAIRGFHSVTLHVADGAPMSDLLKFMGYRPAEADGDHHRFALPTHNNAGIVDVRVSPDGRPARQGAGSVHHVAFAVADRAAQGDVRKALVDAGVDVTDVIDRDYFWAIYFRTPGGILFEVATDEPGFARDEDVAHLGEALKLPVQHAHLRDRLEKELPAITD